jgi:hypothetical protein
MLAARDVHPGRSGSPHRLFAAPAAVALHKSRIFNQSHAVSCAPRSAGRGPWALRTLLAMRRTAEQRSLTFVDGSSLEVGC